MGSSLSTAVTYQVPGRWESRGASSRLIAIGMGADYQICSDEDHEGNHAGHYWATSIMPDKKEATTQWIKRHLPSKFMRPNKHGITPASILALRKQPQTLQTLIELYPGTLGEDVVLFESSAWSGDAETWSIVSKILTTYSKFEETYGSAICFEKSDHPPIAIVLLHRIGPEAVNQFLMLGGHPDQRDHLNRTILHHGAKLGLLDWTLSVEDLGANIHIKDQHGMTSKQLFQESHRWQKDTVSQYWNNRYLDRLNF